MFTSLGKEIQSAVKEFFRNRKYTLPLFLTVLLAYGYSVIHPSIGNDDTAIAIYDVDGLDIQMGRWVLYLLNKVFCFADYAPFFLEVVGVLFLMLSATLFCVLFSRLTGEKDVLAYTCFSCVFVSCPAICELNFYYSHNGVDMSFGLIALSLICFDELAAKKHTLREKLRLCAAMLLLLGLAIGCCESMLIVYVLGVLVVFYMRKREGQEPLSGRRILGYGALAALVCIFDVTILRSVIREVILFAFRLYDVGDGESFRSVGSGIAGFFTPEGRAELVMLCKRFWLVYHVNAFVYLPIFTYASACLVCLADAAANGIRRRSAWFLLLWTGMYLVPFALLLAEWKVPAYRTAQFLPFYSAFGIFLLYGAVRGRYKRLWRRAALACVIVLCYNQASLMNQNFYTEQMIYQDNCRVLNDVALELNRHYDTDLPIVVRGINETPNLYASAYTAPYGSFGYRMVAAVSDLVDPGLKEKYFITSGYNFGVEIYSDFFTFAYAAFDNNSEQFVIFWEHLGYDFRTLKDAELLRKADGEWQEMPSWPKEGSIRQEDGYILIRLGNNLL